MKKAVLGLLASFAFAQAAQAESAYADLKALDCQLYNLGGMATAQYVPETKTVEIVTNFLFRTDYDVRFVFRPSTELPLAVKIEEKFQKWGFELRMKTPRQAGRYNRVDATLVKLGTPGPIFGGPAIPAIDDVVVSTGSCTVEFE